MVRRSLSSLLLALAIVATPVIAHAQQATAVAAPSSFSAGPSVANARVAATMPSVSSSFEGPIHQHMGQAKTLMIVGVAAIIAGAVVEGDSGHIIMVGGAVVGLIGLYQYLH
ncbi:MAG: hypothetical protein JWO05_2106 [Gemmatimonadetes bacterium]|nr:hypothetical protein [Gemmatimonadota bacterium]